VLGRGRRRAPSLTLSDRLFCGFDSLFPYPRTYPKGLHRRSTLLATSQYGSRSAVRRAPGATRGFWRSTESRPSLCTAVTPIRGALDWDGTARIPRGACAGSRRSRTTCCLGTPATWNGSVPSSRPTTTQPAATRQRRATRRCMEHVLSSRERPPHLALLAHPLVDDLVHGRVDVGGGETDPQVFTALCGAAAA